MLKALCIYGMLMGKSVFIGSIITIILSFFAAAGAIGEKSQKRYFFIAFTALMLAVFFPNPEVWQHWLEMLNQ